jgi:hypothetical protein
MINIIARAFSLAPSARAGVLFARSNLLIELEIASPTARNDMKVIL